MCGICGIFALHINEHHEQIIESIVANQNYRGPDHNAVIMIKTPSNQMLLGHNRLSIVDLSHQANQPMWDFTGRYCIVYNGEVYNFYELRAELKQAGLTFNTHSDTEVILNAIAHWGISALERFRGPFAFGLIDTQKNKLWLCRDRFGVRPLYYSKLNNILYFASTTNILAKKLNARPNYQYIARGLEYLIYEDSSSISAYQEILAIPPGCYMEAKFDLNEALQCEIKQYYHLAHNVQNLMENLPLNNKCMLLEVLNHKLEEAINIRLRADVPLAISLSGGLDSSSIAALVKQKQQNLIGFSFSHPQVRQSEGKLVAACAQFLNIKIEYVWPTANEMIEAFYKTIEIQDAPFSSLSVVAQYLLYQRVNYCGIKVLFGGQGGDEAFMGYKKFMLFWLQHLFNERRFFTFTKNSLQLIPMFMAELSSFPIYWSHRHRYLNRVAKNNNPLLPITYSTSRLTMNNQTLWQRQLQDITEFSLPTLLRYEDRNSMANSVESRLPYLDHQIIELGLALPTALKLRSGYGKWIIRDMLKNKIPNKIRLARFKRGFDIQLPDLLKQGLGRSIRSNLQANLNNICDFLQTNINIQQVFSDQKFCDHRVMRQAITLLWLAKALT